MADAPDNLVLEYLRRLDTKVDWLIGDVHGLKVRMTAVEENLAGMQRRIDRLEERLDRRLELSDAPH